MNYNNSNFKKFLSKPVQHVIKKITDSVHFLSPIKNDSYRRHVNFTIEDYITGIIDVLSNYVFWNKYNGFMKGDTLRKKHNEWTKLGVYDHAYKLLLEEHLKQNGKTEELKYQSIDSTFISDINGCKETGYSGIYKKGKGKSDKGIKITSVVTKDGMPTSIEINPANNHDSPLLPKAINKIVIDCNTYRYRNHNRYKQYLLADKGYDSKKNHNFLKKKGYNPLIAQNIRGTKNEKLIRNFSDKEIKIYKNRIKIENYHSWIKKFHKIKYLHERNIEYYRGLVLLGVSIIISRRIIKNKR